MKLLFAATLAILLQSRTASAVDRSFGAPPSEVHYAVQRNIFFSRVGGANLAADLYQPQSKKKTPAVIYLHGGGWWGGTRTQLKRIAEDLAANGFFGMAIDYRLAPAVTFPVRQEDVNGAILWLRAHAASLRDEGRSRTFHPVGTELESSHGLRRSCGVVYRGRSTAQLLEKRRVVWPGAHDSKVLS